jgi:hypothetical protein
MHSFFKLKDGHEVRGFLVRIYPTKDQEEKLGVLSNDARRAWNWLIKQVEDVLTAREGYAIRNGLVGPRPQRPDYDGLDPDASKAAKEAYHEKCRAWHTAVYEATHAVPECAYRSRKEMLTHFGCKHDYQLLAKVIDWGYEENAERPIKPCALMLQALAKNYYTKGNPNSRRKKFRKHSDPMPLQVRSGDCFELGDFGTRGASHKRPVDEQTAPYYNCQVRFNGLKIRGRLPGKAPDARVLKGVSIHKEADGWYASIKLEKPIRKLPPTIPG